MKLSNNMDTRHCCVPLCSNNGIKNPQLSFHKFPSDKNFKKEWLVKIRRDESKLFQVNSGVYVCSSHFTPADFKYTPVRKTLKPGSVPSIFPWRQEKRKRDGLATKRVYQGETAGASHSENNVIQDKEQSEVISPLQQLQCQMIQKDATIQELEAENKRLKLKIEIEKFGLNRFSKDDSMIQFYTGFPSYLSMIAFFNFCRPTAQSMKSPYYVPSEEVNSIAGRPRSMLLEDELFMFLCRLKINCLEDDLAIRFNCSQSTVSRRLIAWINYLYFLLGSIPIWLSRKKIDELMPGVFKAKYASTRVIIDCTEIFTQQPSSLSTSSKLYSSYKSNNTFKALVGIAPHGVVTFVSPLYTGALSDVEITKLCGILDLIEKNDSVMADKGFLVRKLLEEKGAKLNIPPFLISGRFSADECKDTEEIASLRIHVERFIRRVKEYHFFDSNIPLNLIGSINQLWTIACVLANFRGPLIK